MKDQVDSIVKKEKTTKGVAAPKTQKNNVWIIIITDMISKFGLGGSVIAVIIYIFVKEGTIQQHREFIDKFILLKFGTGQYMYIVFLLLLLLIALIGTTRNYRRRIKDKDERIAELQKEKNDLQNKLLR